MYRKVDPSLSIGARFTTKYKYVKDDTTEYFKDIIFLRKDPLAFKSAAFIKRNFNRFCKIAGEVEYKLYKVWVAVKHGVVHMGHGLRDLGKDGVWAARKTSSRY